MFGKTIFFLIAIVSVAHAGVVVSRNAAKCTCGANVYTEKEIDDAIAHGKSHGALKRPQYPHDYNNHEAFTHFVCPQKAPPYIEFPVLASKALFNNGDKPDTDRVIYDQKGNFCGCITHTGAPQKNGFVKCT